MSLKFKKKGDYHAMLWSFNVCVFNTIERYSMCAVLCESFVPRVDCSHKPQCYLCQKKERLDIHAFQTCLAVELAFTLMLYGVPLSIEVKQYACC